MAKNNKHHQLAAEILEKVGGAQNVEKATHCATRLRLFLKNDQNVSLKEIDQIPGVVSAVKNAGQYQIVIGQHVRNVYDEFTELAGPVSPSSDTGSQTQEKTSVLNKVIGTMSAVFAPFIYILASAGILQGVLLLANLAFPGVADTTTYAVFNLISWGPFIFLPIFIAVTGARHFGSNPYLAIAANAALVSPLFTDLASRVAEGEVLSFFGFALSSTTYTSTVLPALFLVWGLSYLEKLLDRILPELLRPLFTPFFALAISVPLTILIIGPISGGAANLLADGMNYLFDTVPILAGAVVGAFWQVFVLFGVHWGITPALLANHDLYGRDAFQVYQTIAVLSQVGAALGVAIKAKDKALKSVGFSSTLTGFFGITEPAIYGVNLRYKKPFIIACISGGIGGIVASLFNPYYYVYAGLPGMLTLVNAINPDNPSSFIGAIVGAAIAIILPVVLIQFIGFGEDSTDSVEKAVKPLTAPDHSVVSETEGVIESAPVTEILSQPIEGLVLALSEVPDPVFSSAAMGQGVAIKPTAGQVVAPVSGQISFVAGTKHAVGLVSDGGAEILIHFGIDTVNLDGAPFVVHVENGERVERGQLILEADLKMIEAAGLSTITPIIITNTAAYSAVEAVTDGNLEQMLVVKK